MNRIREDRVESGDVLVHVVIAAQPATVWSFFDDPGRFASWIGAFGGGPPLPGTSIEPEVGGSVRVCYPGQGPAAVGTITAMEPMRRIVMTWGYEGGHGGIEPGGTEVEITFSAVPEGTRVQLRHAGLPTDDARQGHLGGWKHYLSMLARGAAERQHADHLAMLWADYFRSWGEVDEAARRSLLASCCEPDIRLRSGFACTDGLASLSQHMANAQRHMPGMTLQMEAEPKALHGFSRVQWKIVGPGGEDLMHGVNFAELSATSRIKTLVSFEE